MIMLQGTRERGRDMTGSATVACLMTTFFILSAGMTTLMVLLSKQAVAKRAIEVDQAYVEAEAGADLCLAEVRANIDFAADGVGVVSGNAATGTFAASVTPPFAGPGTYTIVSAGTVRGITRTINVSIMRGSGPPGFTGYDGISMSGGLIDTYDSSAGTYASQPHGADANVASNGNISLSGSAQIKGNATPGPGGTVSGAAGVSGSTAPASSTMPVTPYTYSPPIAASGAYSGTSTFGSGTYRYTQFTVGGGQSVTFNGNVVLYVDGKFTISGSGFGKLNPGATLVIHHGSNTFTISGGGVINSDLSPANLTVNSATTSAVTFSGSAGFYGSMHAPYAPLTASGGAGVYGALVAKQMTLSGGMSLHYDRQFGGGGTFAVRLMRPLGRTAGKS